MSSLARTQGRNQRERSGGIGETMSAKEKEKEKEKEKIGLECFRKINTGTRSGE